jgi:hypothetical protein
MSTNRPQNLDDEDLANGMRAGRPICQPTTMTYGMFRIQLGEISKHLSDRTPVAAINSAGPSYDVVMDIDTELQNLLDSMPPYFSMSVKQISELYQMDLQKATGIARQGHIFRSLALGQRCKLHLGFLARGYTDAEYALSRDVCVESARTILRLEVNADATNLGVHNQYRPLGLIMACFIACIVLLMDLCHSKGSPHHERQRAEIASAFRLLEDVRHESAMAAKLICSMTHVLHKHQITPPNMAPRPFSMDSSLTEAPNCPIIRAVTDGYDVPVVPEGASCTGAMINEHNGVDMTYFPDLAQSLDQGMIIDNFNWSDLFSDLETAFA